MEKLLPIKFFEKRKIDEQLTEAGGDRRVPKWVLQGDELTDHAQKLSGKMSQVAASYDAYKKADHKLPMVMATTVREEAIAKSHRKAIVDLLSSDSSSEVIGVDADRMQSADGVLENLDDNRATFAESRKILSVVTSDELLANIYRILQNSQDSAKLVSSITGIDVYVNLILGQSLIEF